MILRKQYKPGSEALITRNIRMYLRYNRIFHWKAWQGLGSEKGVADIIGIKKVKVADLVKAGIEEIGQFMAIEVKTENGKLSKHQKNFLDRVKGEGGIGFVARSEMDVYQEFENGIQ